MKRETDDGKLVMEFLKSEEVNKKVDVEKQEYSSRMRPEENTLCMATFGMQSWQPRVLSFYFFLFDFKNNFQNSIFQIIFQILVFQIILIFQFFILRVFRLTKNPIFFNKISCHFLSDKHHFTFSLIFKCFEISVNLIP